MKIKLYTGLHEDVRDNNLKTISLEINGCSVSYTDYENDGECHGFWRRRFSYSRDSFYKHALPRYKLNTRIEISESSVAEHVGDDSPISGILGYCYLNPLQYFWISWSFKDTWLQKSENIKWLISIPISILTAYITTKIVK